jgi:hypothetical protein
MGAGSQEGTSGALSCPFYTVSPFSNNLSSLLPVLLNLPLVNSSEITPHVTFQDVLERIHARKKRKEQLSDRKSLAAQNRMKSIAGLAADEQKGGGSVGGRKRKRAGGEDDGFGQNDADWAVYREIVRLSLLPPPSSPPWSD